MIESTARVERSPVVSPSRPGYLWEVPQKPVSVYLPFEMIDRLESLVVESFRSLTSKGSEIGGLLVGRASQGSPLVVLVENFELVSCDYSRGPLYRLSEVDMGRFERAIEQSNSGSGPRVVGFFRSHTRKGLSLDPDDVAFLDVRFREPQQIALLVRPFASKASTGAIFIRESGTMRTESSYLEFPFRSSQLTAAAAPPKIESAPAAEPPPAAPAPQKPPVRGQIVPIASRREITVPPPAPPPAPEPAVQPAPVVEPPAPAAVQPPPPPAAPKPPIEAAVRAPEKPAEKPAERTAEKPAERLAARRAEPAVPKSLTPVEEAPAEAKGGSKLVWVMVVLALLAMAGGGYFFYPGFHKAAPPPSTSADNLQLGLSVEHSGPDLLLTWNRDSYGAKNGKVGKLLVSDGDSRQNYDIDRAQLISGLGVVYSPLTQDVSFEMEVTNDKGAIVGKGAARVLHPRPSPLGEPKDSAASKQSTTPTPKTDTPAEPAAAANPAPAADAAAEKPATPAPVTRKAFNPDSLAGNRLRQASPTDLSNAMPDAPSVGAGAAPQAGSLPGANLGGIAPPPPRTNAPPPPSNKASASQISQAVLVYKRDPEYPKIAQQMGQRGVVELVATIGIDGRVKGVKVLKGPPMLQKPAQEAVMQWIYKPTVLNGTPVENETHISINFEPPR